MKTRQQPIESIPQTSLSPRETALACSPVGRLVLSYAWPAMIGMLVNAMYNVVDRFWIGQMDNTAAMSGIGLMGPMMNILLGFMQLIGVGATATISIRLGQKRYQDAETVLGNALTLCLLVGLGLSVLTLAFLDPILMLFGASDATLPYARAYGRIILLGNVLNTISFAMNHTIRGGGNPKRSASTQILGAVINMVLDPLFIFGFGWGVTGAAAATIISQGASMVWVMSYYLFGGKSLVRLRLTNMKLQKPIVTQILAIGLSPFAMQVAASFVAVLANRALKTHGGDIAIGAMTVINSMAILFMMPLFGINQGLQPILGYNYGAGHYKRVRQAWLTGVRLASLIVAIGFLIVQLFPSQIIRTFINDPDLIRIGTFGLRIFLSMLPLLGFQIVTTVYFQSIGKARVAIFASLLRQVIILIPLYLILPHYFGLAGVWFCSPIADLASFLITGILIWHEMRNLKAVEDKQAERIETEKCGTN